MCCFLGKKKNSQVELGNPLYTAINAAPSFEETDTRDRNPTLWGKPMSHCGISSVDCSAATPGKNSRTANLWTFGTLGSSKRWYMHITLHILGIPRDNQFFCAEICNTCSQTLLISMWQNRFSHAASALKAAHTMRKCRPPDRAIYRWRISL